MPSSTVRRVWGSLFVCIAIGVAIGFSSTEFRALASDDCQAQVDGDFSVILLPDTQNYSEKFPRLYLAQTEWVREQQKTLNIRFAIHLGDIVQNPTVEKEWIVADRAHGVLDGIVPYSVVPGNHDMEGRDTTLYNKFFSPTRFQCCQWYGGHKGETNDNNYCTFEAAGMKFLVLSLEYAPGADTLEWANGILAENRDSRVIVATHSYLNGKGRNSHGECIWEDLVRQNANVFLVVCGHVSSRKMFEGIGDAGTKVFEMLVDYQGDPNGGDGWLRILHFSPSRDKILVRDYSPALDQYRDGAAANFSLDYPMLGSVSKEAKKQTLPVGTAN